MKFHNLWKSSLLKKKKGHGRLGLQSTKTDSAEFGQILVNANLTEIQLRPTRPRSAKYLARVNSTEFGLGQLDRIRSGSTRSKFGRD